MFPIRRETSALPVTPSSDSSSPITPDASHSTIATLASGLPDSVVAGGWRLAPPFSIYWRVLLRRCLPSLGGAPLTLLGRVPSRSNALLYRSGPYPYSGSARMEGLLLRPCVLQTSYPERGWVGNVICGHLLAGFSSVLPLLWVSTLSFLSFE